MEKLKNLGKLVMSMGFILFLSTPVIRAENTPYLNLEKIPAGTTDWHLNEWANVDKIDAAVGPEHNTDGTHKTIHADDVITKGPWVDVRAFGAVGDGVADDAAAIQAAIDSLDVRRGVVFFPPGSYRITSTITIGGGITLLGSAGSNSPSMATEIKNDGTGVAITTTDEARFWAIRNLAINGNANSSHGIQTGVGASNYTIENVYVSGHEDGVYIPNRNWMATLKNVFSSFNRGNGFTITYGGATGGLCDIVLERTFARGNGGNGYTISGVKGLSVISSAADGNSSKGWYISESTGTLLSCTAESNVNTAFQFMDAGLVVISPWVDGDPSLLDSVPYEVVGGSRPVVFIHPTSSNTTGYGYSLRVFPGVTGSVTVIEPRLDKKIEDNGKISFLVSEGSLEFVKGISMSKTASRNLSGQVTISGTDQIAVYTFPAAEPNNNYFLTITPVKNTGTPAAGSNRVLSVQKQATNFQLTVEAAPGEGNSVTFDWHLIQS